MNQQPLPSVGDNRAHRALGRTLPRAGDVTDAEASGWFRSLRIKCPSCGALPHAPCHNLVTGRPNKIKDVHDSRIIHSREA